MSNLQEVGNKLLATQQETNRLLRAIAKRLDKHEQELRTIRRRIATTSVPIYAETNEVSYDEVMETLGNIVSETMSGGASVRGQSDVRVVDDPDGESVARFPQPDGAWLVVYTEDSAITRMYYEDRHGNRTPVIVNENGDIITVGDEDGD